MNPPERHLAAVPDAPTTQRRGKSKTLEDARATAEAMAHINDHVLPADMVRDFQATPTVPDDVRAKILADARAGAADDEAAMEQLNALLAEGSVAGQRRLPAAVLEASTPKAQAADVIDQARAMGIIPPIPGVPAREPMVLRPAPRPTGYRRMGRARKRELAENRRVAGHVLTQQRERVQAERRAQRAARG